jgi:xanthine dehydrogenase YagR molybdenum-binding subunit
MAAKMIGRPVRIELWRPQMWGSVGYRPPTVQRVALGATADGKLTAQVHEVLSTTAMFDEFIEPSGMITAMMYASPALRVTHELSRINRGTPTYMRAPGESSGSFALESAMDELAYATGLCWNRLEFGAAPGAMPADGFNEVSGDRVRIADDDAVKRGVALRYPRFVQHQRAVV